MEIDVRDGVDSEEHKIIFGSAEHKIIFGGEGEYLLLDEHSDLYLGRNYVVQNKILAAVLCELPAFFRAVEKLKEIVESRE